MGDFEITVARDYLKGANGHFEGLDAVGQPGALGDAKAGTGQYTTFSLGNGSKDSAVAVSVEKESYWLEPPRDGVLLDD